MSKRILLFLLTNILVMITIFILVIIPMSIVLSLLGIQGYIEGSGINYESLLVFCIVWGMVGAFISLLLSKTMAKWSMGVKIIKSRSASRIEAQLIETIHSLSQKARLPNMPEVGIYDSPEVNAFATGASKRNSLVAVSTGLLNSMNSEEVEGVLGHEIAHIANGDMVTMTLIQGVVNAFAMFLSRVLAFAIQNFMRGDEEREGGFSYGLHFILTIVFDILFTLLGSIVVAAFSRSREFRADAGGARIAGKERMISALQRLQTNANLIDNREKSFASMKISNKPSWLALFSTHPPLEVRIQKLKSAR